MPKNRREFIRLSGLAGLGIATSGSLSSYISCFESTGLETSYASATLEDGSIIKTPFWRIDSGKDGPALLLLAAQHGNEIQGVEVALRFREICSRQLVSGSVWLLPMANIPAIRQRKHSVNLGAEQPISFAGKEGNNMNRHWPGDPHGNDTERIVFSQDQAVVKNCSHGVDIHCWNHFTAASTLAYRDHEPSRLMGVVAATRFINYSDMPVLQGNATMIRRWMPVRDRGAVTIELSGQYQMLERQIMIGLNTMINISRQLGMIHGDPVLPEGPKAVVSSETRHDVLASCPGIFMPASLKDSSRSLMTDDFVREGQQLGHIISAEDLSTVTVISPVDGYLYRLGTCHENCDVSLPAQHPFVEKGHLLAIVIEV
jgi:uncharacterized protein